MVSEIASERLSRLVGAPGRPIAGGDPWAAPVEVQSPLQQVASHFGIMHVLVAVDLAAWAVATALLGSFDHVGFVALLVAILGLNAAGGQYAPKLALSVLDQLGSLVGRALVAGALVVALKLVTGTAGGEVIVRTAVLYAALAVLGRCVIYPVMRRLRSTGWRSHSVLILGAGRVGGQVADTLRAHPEYGLRPVGFVDDNPLSRPHEQTVPLLGRCRRPVAAPRRSEHPRRRGRVRLATRESKIVDVLRTCDRLACEIFFVPRLFELQAHGQRHGPRVGLPAGADAAGAVPLADLAGQAAVRHRASRRALSFLAPLFAASIAVRRSRVGRRSSSGRSGSAWTAAPSRC